MAEISLKEYHHKLEALLKANQAEEAVHHCRHILQYFPRNAATYRYLGRALLASNSLAEAEEVFRRVLSVYPDDLTAHTSLAAIYRQRGQYDAAVWHLERAYEQDTARLEHQKALRELYRQQRGVDQPRLQLTAGAAARHYISSGLYDQAVRTLRQALAAAPQRADLCLLLARAFEENGQRVESAEAALDTLELLPDCLEANRIMARFWLSEQRPSDAQRYVSRIEALDPYEAYLIAQGGPPPEGTFTLPELDYDRVVKRQLATQALDWLEVIDVPLAETAESAEGVSEPAASSGLPDWLPPDTDSLNLNDIFQTFEPASEANLSAAPDDFDFAFEDDLPADEPPPVERTGLTGMLASLKRERPSQAEPLAEADEPALASGKLADWLPEVSSLEATDAATDDADAAWFGALAAEADVFDADTPEPLANAEAVSAHPAADPLAWLRGGGIELAEEDASAPATLSLDDEEMVYSDPNAVDPLAWLRGSGIELAEEDASAPPAPSPADEAEMGYSDSSPAEPLTWLHSSSVERVDENASMSKHDVAAPAAPLSALPVQPYNDDDAALDWLSDDSLLQELLGLEAMSGAELAEAAAALPEKPSGWKGLTDTLPGRGDMALFSTGQLEDRSVSDHKSDWQADMPDNDQRISNWLQPDADEPDPPERAFAWLNDAPSEAESGEASSEASSEQFDWLTNIAEEPATPASNADPVPDWLGGTAQTSPLRPDVLAGADEAALGGWLPGEDQPEWLTQLTGNAQPPASAEPAFEAGAELEWLEGEVSEPNAPPAPWAAAEAEPEWLTQLAGGAEPEGSAEAEPAVGFNWTGEVSAEVEAEPLADVPEWLTAAAPLAADEPAAMPEAPAVEADEAAFEWGFEPQADAEPLADVPEWLTAAAPLAADEPAAMPEAPAVEADEAAFGWGVEPQAELARDETVELADTAQLSEPFQADDVRLWDEDAAEAVPLAERDYFDVVEAQPEIPVEADELSAWLETIRSSAVEPAVKTELDDLFEPARSEFDWLAEVSEAASSAAEEPLAAEFEPTYGSEAAGPSETRAPGPDDWDAADWLADEAPAAPELAYGLEPTGRSAFEAEMPAPTEADDWLPADAEDAELLERLHAAAHRPPPADNAPEWLNNMVPGLELDYTAEEDALVESAFVEPQPAETGVDFEWLNRIVEEETSPVLAVSAAEAAETADRLRQPRFVFTREPVWLRRAAPPAGAAPADRGNDDFELPEWLR